MTFSEAFIFTLADFFMRALTCVNDRTAIEQAMFLVENRVVDPDPDWIRIQ
jgi:hypothetical protein